MTKRSGITGRFPRNERSTEAKNAVAVVSVARNTVRRSSQLNLFTEHGVAEFVFFIIVAWLITKTKIWNRAPKLRDHASLSTAIRSLSEESPVKYAPGADAKTETEDPNENPHYIWDED